MRQRLLDLFFRVFVIGEFTGEVLFVRGHVKMAVPAQIEEDGLLFPFLFRLQGLVDRASDREGGFRGNNNALGAREGYCRFEAFSLPGIDCFDHTLTVQ